MGALGFGAGVVLRQASASAAGMFDFTGGALPAGVTLTRASAGVRCNAAGVLVSEGVDVARFDYDPATLALAGLLLESAQINTLTYSEQFDNAAWTKSSVTAVANDRVAPDGTTSAERLTMVSGGLLQRTGIGSAGAAITASMWLYASAATSGLKFGCYDNVLSGQYAAVTLPAGSWTRVMLTRTFGAGATDRRLQLLAPSGGATVWCWGAQGEAAAAGSSYMPTAGATASRSADMLTLALPVADGAVTLRATFDDLSTQDIVVNASGGQAPLPASLLNRARVRRIEKL